MRDQIRVFFKQAQEIIREIEREKMKEVDKLFKEVFGDQDIDLDEIKTLKIIG